MKTLLLTAVASYLVTWCSGIFIARRSNMDRKKARTLHFSLSLITCTLLTATVVMAVAP